MQNRFIYMFTALALGLAWALRGHFGHEHGAFWAGSLGSIAVILSTRRQDWLAKLPGLAFIGGLGWAVGGMMSYGLVVGYGRGSDFANVYYGLAMLAVIGGLYGFIGGGLFALELESTEKNKAAWASLLTEMIAGALVFWYVIIAQFEWKMTPPRSELWAACLGASVALAWHLHRNGYNRSLAVAGYAALGAGFGFAFGNFLQVMGTLTGLHFNWWNLMEFTLGFFGGLGLAYGVATRTWPASRPLSRVTQSLAIWVLFLGIPLINVIQNYTREQLVNMSENLGWGDPGGFIALQSTLIAATIVLFTWLGFRTWRRYKAGPALAGDAMGFFSALMVYYILFSNLIKGTFFMAYGFQLEQMLYWIIFAMMILLWFRNRHLPPFDFKIVSVETGRKWLLLLGATLAILLILTIIAISSHAPLPHAQVRFE